MVRACFGQGDGTRDKCILGNKHNSDFGNIILQVLYSFARFALEITVEVHSHPFWSTIVMTSSFDRYIAEGESFGMRWAAKKSTSA